MLIISYQHVRGLRNKKEDADKLFLYGQEANPKTLALGKMNLYIHDISNAQLVLGDTLLRPKFKEGEEVKKFDVVLANPPWNQDRYDEDMLKKGEFWQKRFSYGFTPAQSADWAWIQHMLASTEKNGRVGIVIDNGCLFRGGKEGAIRKQIVDRDLIECVMLLPEKLFYNTGAPGAILILRHQKPKERAGKILFINASQKFEKHPEVKRLNRLGDKQIEEIVKVYKSFGDEDSFSRVVSREEVAKNDYNLSVTRYVDISDESEHVDIPQTWKEVKVLDKDLQALEVKLGSYLKEIGYED
jgi:type I restriction enzyme M protein